MEHPHFLTPCCHCRGTLFSLVLGLTGIACAVASPGQEPGLKSVSENAQTDFGHEHNIVFKMSVKVDETHPCKEFDSSLARVAQLRVVREGPSDAKPDMGSMNRPVLSWHDEQTDDLADEGEHDERTEDFAAEGEAEVVKVSVASWEDEQVTYLGAALNGACVILAHPLSRQNTEEGAIAAFTDDLMEGLCGTEGGESCHADQAFYESVRQARLDSGTHVSLESVLVGDVFASIVKRYRPHAQKNEATLARYVTTNAMFGWSSESFDFESVTELFSLQYGTQQYHVYASYEEAPCVASSDEQNGGYHYGLSLRLYKEEPEGNKYINTVHLQPFSKRTANGTRRKLRTTQFVPDAYESHFCETSLAASSEKTCQGYLSDRGVAEVSRFLHRALREKDGNTELTAVAKNIVDTLVLENHVHLFCAGGRGFDNGVRNRTNLRPMPDLTDDGGDVSDGG